jgi:hypothetical protein
METGREMGRWNFRTVQTLFPGVFLAAGVLLCLLVGCEEAEPEESFGACEEPVAMPVTEDKSITTDPFEMEALSEIERSGLCVLVEDFDGDDPLGIFTVDLGLETEWTHPVVLYWGNGEGTFVHETMDVEMKPNGACTYGDVNGDGLFDRMVAGKNDHYKPGLASHGHGTQDL